MAVLSDRAQAVFSTQWYVANDCHRQCRSGIFPTCPPTHVTLARHKPEDSARPTIITAITFIFGLLPVRYLFRYNRDFCNPAHSKGSSLSEDLPFGPKTYNFVDHTIE